MNCRHDRLTYLKGLWQKRYASWFFCPLIWAGLISVSYAQSIVPAADGTATQVHSNGSQITINGGQLSGDRANLFHSFQEFGVNQGQIATFLSNSAIKNILARVVGGNVSVIDGLMQVTGGNSNLFLMNPAGIVFGANARLNVPASFVATTANGIGFEAGQLDREAVSPKWFTATGQLDYAQLVGQPNLFLFAGIESGTIANFGNLSVTTGQNLTLLGGSVLNAGQLSAPGGQITVAAVPGENLVRVSQPGSLLSLEFIALESDRGQQLQPVSVNQLMPLQTPATLPALLTGGSVGNATQVQVNADGSLQLAGSTLNIPTQPATAIVSGQLNVTPASQTGNLATPAINVLGPNVALINARLDASGATAGTIRIGGDYQGNGSLPNAQFTFVDAQTVIAANGRSPISSNTIPANGGKVIIWADNTTRFYGSIQAQGGTTSGNGGLVEVSGKQSLIYRGTVDTSAPAGKAGSLLLDPVNIRIVGTATAPDDAQISDGQIFASDPGDTFTISRNALQSVFGDIFLQATNDIIIDLPPNDTLSFFSSVTSVTFQADADFDGIGVFQSSPSVLIQTSGIDPIPVSISGASVFVGDINTSNPFGGGGDVTLIAHQGGVTTRNITTSSVDAGNGDVGGSVLISGGETINAGRIITSGDLGGGDVQLEALSPTGNVRFGSIDTTSSTGIGGDVTLTAGRFVEGFGQIAGPGTPTIDTTGSIDSGFVFIEHGGGSLGVPFVVGSPTVNGTVGGIRTGIDDLVVPPSQAFPGNYLSPAGYIEILTSPPPGSPDPASELSPEDQEDFADDLEFEDDLAEFPDFEAEDNDTFDAPEEETEEEFTGEFEDYLDLPEELAIQPNREDTLKQVAGVTGVKPALVYLTYVPATVVTERSLHDERIGRTIVSTDLSDQSPNQVEVASLPSRPSEVQWQFNGQGLATDAERSQPEAPQKLRGSDQLEILVITPDGRPIRKLVAGVTRDLVQTTVQTFLNEVTDPRKVRTRSYLTSSQQLYRWLIAPIESELKDRKISNLAFIADTGLRFIPMAALHDGQQFLAEKYSLGLMPSLSLTDTRFVSLKNARVLAMGASEFVNSSQLPLPAVPTELSVVVQELGEGRSFLNQEFTLSNLQGQRQQEAYQIIHLATHGEFQPGDLSNSYIQLWDTQLRLNELRKLGWNNPPVELLVLSACRTAFGSEDAELGFAGFAVQAGVKSALASLWYVNDEGTLGLMTEFYRQLQTAPIKAEALRQAQIAMIQGQVQFTQGRLQDSTGKEIPLPQPLAELGDRTLNHPYYWAAFTLIGSPW